jgi:hypothetical protein
MVLFGNILRAEKNFNRLFLHLNEIADMQRQSTELYKAEQLLHMG